MQRKASGADDLVVATDIDRMHQGYILIPLFTAIALAVLLHLHNRSDSSWVAAFEGGFSPSSNCTGVGRVSKHAWFATEYYFTVFRGGVYSLSAVR
jgi:hypothetical protein